MDLRLKLLLLVLLAIPALGRVRRQGTLEDTPVLPFSAQSRVGDESPSLEIQNENAEKGIIDNKDAEVEEVLEYVDESNPGSDPEAEMEQAEANEEPGMESVIQDGQPIGRVVQDQRIPGGFFQQPQFGMQGMSNSTESPKPEGKPWYKNSTIWIIVGVIGGIILLLILICICIKCRK